MVCFLVHVASLWYGTWPGRFFRKAVGPVLELKALRILSVLLWYVVGACLLLRPALAPWRWTLSCLLYALSTGLFWWAIRTNLRQPLALAFSDEQPGPLVTAGPYRLVRHPLYTAYMLGWLAAIAGTRTPWILAVLATFPFFWLAARREEQSLAQGPMAAEYAAYRRRVGGFLPRLWEAR